MNKKLMVFAAMAAMLTVSSLFAVTETVNGISWTYTVSGDKATLVGSSTTPSCIPNSTAGTVTIPSTLGGKTVTSIGYQAFYNCSELTAITIPDSITSISSWAFSGCSGLTSVTIPNSVTSIGAFAFYNCSGLTSVTIPNSVTSIGGRAFSGCSGLTSVTIPPNVASIGDDAFKGCSSIMSVTIPASVASIGTQAFSGCSNCKSFHVDGNNPYYQSVNGLLLAQNGKTLVAGVIGEVTIPDSVTSIGASAFYGNSGLTSVTIPNSVTSIGASAFYNCSGLTSVTIPNSVTSIGASAFAKCTQLSVITFMGPVADFGSLLSDIPSSTYVNFQEQYGAEWRAYIFSQNLNVGGYVRPQRKAGILSAAFRENDPTILDVTYRVLSDTNTPVNVRALAFVDGERSFAKVVRPETFVEGTAIALGDGISVNEEHRVSWRVSSAWNADLENVSFEIFVAEQGRLPLELTTIPAAGDIPAIQFSWNAQSDGDVLNALFWHYANHEDDLVLDNGVLSSGGTILATDGHLGNSSKANKQFATQYVFKKMGYSLLSGEALAWVKNASRLKLSPSGASQYAIRLVGDFSSHEYDRPGLIQATIQATALDLTTDPALLSCRRELGPAMAFTTGSYTSPIDGITTAWANNTQFLYRGQIYLEGGTTYTFGACIDDWDYIKIDGIVVIRDSSHSSFDTGNFTCQETGWHDIDIRIGNGTGSSGYYSGFPIGIGYNTTGQKTANGGTGWTRLVDPGDGSLLRTAGVHLLFPLFN